MANINYVRYKSRVELKNMCRAYLTLSKSVDLGVELRVCWLLIDIPGHRKVILLLPSYLVTCVCQWHLTITPHFDTITSKNEYHRILTIRQNKTAPSHDTTLAKSKKQTNYIVAFTYRHIKP